MSLQTPTLEKVVPQTDNFSGYFTDDPLKISEIYRKNINISIWQRELNSKLIQAGEYILQENPELQLSEVVDPGNINEILIKELGSSKELLTFSNDISNIVNMFCNLFELKKVWLRLDAIDQPMCPRFHADNVKCRLVTTYIGPATQWLSHHKVNRAKLGHGNEGKTDAESGLFSKNSDIQQLCPGHIALLKGESWDGNQGAGIVHRSPHEEGHYKRLYMTIDFVELYLRIYQNSLKGF